MATLRSLRSWLLKLAAKAACEIIFFISLLFIISCQSTPDTFLTTNAVSLNTGALAYVFANVQEARPILEILPIEELENKQVRQMLDRTNFAVVAIFPEDSGLRFQLTAFGNYPRSGAGIALSFDKTWIRQKSVTKQNYWYSAENKLSVAVTSKQIFAAVSLTDRPADPFVSGAEIPEGFSDFSRGAALSCWIENPAPVFQQLLNDAGVPIRVPVDQLFVNLNPIAAENYEAVLRLQFENATQARGVAAILNLAGRFTTNDPDLALVMLFITNPPVQDGSNLVIKTGAMSKDELLQILNNFLD